MVATASRRTVRRASESAAAWARVRGWKRREDWRTEIRWSKKRSMASMRAL